MKLNAKNHEASIKLLAQEFEKVQELKGIPGKQGLPGNDGRSAYEIAREHGFTGTEAEWLASLKGLSTNDYTTAEKNKLSGIEAGANKTTVDTALSATSTNPVQNKVVKAALDEKANANAVISYITEDRDSDTVTIMGFRADGLEQASALVEKATQSYAGAMSAADKTKLDGIATGANKTVVDSTVTASGTNPVSGKAVADYVGTSIAASDAMIFKGTLGTGGTVTALPTTYKTGWTYRVITAGTYAGQKCEVGGLIIALVDRAGSGNVNADWTVAQTNIDGAITSISGTSPISVTGSGASRTIAHKASGVSAGSYGEGSDKTVAFGDILSIPYISVDAIGHVTGADIDTITFPDNVVTASANGLMSSTDKIKLDEVLETKRVYDVISKGQTSVNIKLPDNAIGDILSVCAVCDNTGEEAIIDWGYRYDTAQAGYVVHCSIAQPYTEAIGITVLCV